MKSKTFLYLLIVLAIVAIAAFVIYQLVYRVNTSVTTGGAAGQAGSLPFTQGQPFSSSSNIGATSPVAFNAGGANESSSSSKFGIVSNDHALDYFVSPANIVELIKLNGSIETISNNAATVISSTTFSNIISSSFSYDGKKAFVSTRQGTSTQTSVFDAIKDSWTPLPGNIQSPVWSPVDYELAYLAPSNAGTESIFVIDLGVTNPKPVTIASFVMENSLLQWPDKTTIIISDRPSAYTAGSIWSFDIPSKILSSVVNEDAGAESTWSSSGAALLFSAGAKNAGGFLTFSSPAGAQKQMSFLTLPSKCVFSTPANATDTSNIFYCATPDDQSTFAIVRLPDEYDQKVYFSNDDFYRIDPGTGALDRIFSFSAANLNLDATQLKVFNNVLFFINRYDQKIYALAL
jgi:hypothetical protein